MLPDNSDHALLHIFNFDRQVTSVHVCSRWRSVIFASPNILDLRPVCGHGTRVELTGIWPPLPIIIGNIFDLLMHEDYGCDAAIVRLRSPPQCMRD